MGGFLWSDSLSKVYCVDGESMMDLEMPFPDERHKVVGYCNGLFCLEYGDGDGKIVVWKPSDDIDTSSLEVVPYPSNLVPPISGSCSYNGRAYTSHSITSVCGFGQDIHSHRYKVVAIVSTYFDVGGFDDDFLKQFYVYTIGNDEGGWEEISYPESVCWAGVIDSRGASANGCCYWMADAHGSNLTWHVRILSLDLTTLEFSLIDLPVDEYLSPTYSNFILTELDGGLGLIRYRVTELKTELKDMSTWVLMGGGEWKHKHFSQFRFSVQKPLGYLDHHLMLLEGQGLQQDATHLLIYDYVLDKFWNSDLIHDHRCPSMRLFPFISHF